MRRKLYCHEYITSNQSTLLTTPCQAKQAFVSIGHKQWKPSPSIETSSFYLSKTIGKIIFLLQKFGWNWQFVSLFFRQMARIFRKWREGEDKLKVDTRWLFCKLAEQPKTTFIVSQCKCNCLAKRWYNSLNTVIAITVKIMVGMTFQRWSDSRAHRCSRPSHSSCLESLYDVSVQLALFSVGGRRRSTS